MFSTGVLSYTPNIKLYLKDFGTSINFANNTITNFGYGLNNLAMVGYTRNDGTVSGGVTIVDGALSNSTASGTNEVASGAIDFTSNKPFSISAFFNPSNITPPGVGRQANIVNIRGSSTTIGIGLRLTYNASGEPTSFEAGMRDASLQNSVVSVTPGWNHAVMTYDGTNLRTYHNSVLVNTRSGVSVGSAVATFIGGSKARGGVLVQYVGAIQGVSMYNRELSQGEITQLFNAGRNAYSPISSGLVAQYSGRNFAGTTSAPTTIYDTRYITQISATDTRTVLNNLGAQYINYGGVMFSASDSYSVLANYRLDSTAVNQRIISRMTGSNGNLREPTLQAYNATNTDSRWGLRNATTSFVARVPGITTGRNQISAYYNQPTGDFGILSNAIVAETGTFTGTMQSGSNNTILFAQSPSTSDQNLIGGLQSLMVLDLGVLTTGQFASYYERYKVV